MTLPWSARPLCWPGATIGTHGSGSGMEPCSCSPGSLRSIHQTITHIYPASFVPFSSATKTILWLILGACAGSEVLPGVLSHNCICVIHWSCGVPSTDLRRDLIEGLRGLLEGPVGLLIREPRLVPVLAVVPILATLRAAAHAPPPRTRRPRSVGAHEDRDTARGVRLGVPQGRYVTPLPAQGSRRWGVLKLTLPREYPSPGRGPPAGSSQQPAGEPSQPSQPM